MRYGFTRRHCLPLLAGAVVALASAPAGCKREPKTVKVVATEGEGPVLASTVRTSAPSQEPQLLAGFYGIEANAWRWTGKQFSVLLRAPTGSAHSGAILSLAFSIPDVALAHAQSITLAASAEGVALPPETYRKSGQYEYRCEVPPAALSKDAVHIQFSLDHAIPPSGGDRRELGVIVASIGLEPR